MPHARRRKRRRQQRRRRRHVDKTLLRARNEARRQRTRRSEKKETATTTTTKRRKKRMEKKAPDILQRTEGVRINGELLRLTGERIEQGRARVTGLKELTAERRMWWPSHCRRWALLKPLKRSARRKERRSEGLDTER